MKGRVISQKRIHDPPGIQGGTRSPYPFRTKDQADAHRRRMIERIDIESALKDRDPPTPETVDRFDKAAGEGEV